MVDSCHLLRHLSRWCGGSGMGSSGSFVLPAMKVFSKPPLIRILPVSNPLFRSLTRPVPVESDYL